MFHLGTKRTKAISSLWVSRGIIWDLCLSPLELLGFPTFCGKQGRENELEIREPEVHAVPLARSFWVGLPGCLVGQRA